MKPRPSITRLMISGLIFLIPFTAVFYLLVRCFQFMVIIGEPIANFMPFDQVAGIALVNILAVAMILLVCFLAGIASQSVLGDKLHSGLNERLLNIFPRYGFLKNMAEGMAGIGYEERLKPVRVTFDDHQMVGLEVERTDDRRVVVYLPGSPDPWSGSVATVEIERVEPMQAPFKVVIKALRTAGVGMKDLK